MKVWRTEQAFGVFGWAKEGVPLPSLIYGKKTHPSKRRRLERIEATIEKA
ncbi:MAG: hypothetical protein ACLT2S_07780 [Christensenellales bacterium]